MKSLTSWVILAGVLFLQAGLHASEELVAISEDVLEEDEANIWLQVNKEEQAIRTSSANLDDPLLTEHSSKILCNLVGSACSAFRSYVIRSPGFNAFIMPNGAMFLQTGMLLRVKDDSELAAVIGHEASHYFNRHTLHLVRRVFRTNDAVAVIGAVVSGSRNALGALQTGYMLTQLAHLSYSRDNELEADADGVAWMSRAAYDPKAALALWQGQVAEGQGTGESGFLRGFFSTHPAPPTRIDELEKRISTLDSQVSTAEAPPGKDISDLVDPYRENWLLDEMSVLAPEQFSRLLASQVEAGFPSHDAAYLEGVSYTNKAKSEEAEDGRKESSEHAISAFKRSLETGGEQARPETHRRLGELHESLGELSEAKAAYLRYLELAPDAWDARFIKRKI